MTKTLFSLSAVLSAGAILLGGCRREATVPADKARDATTVQPENARVSSDVNNGVWQIYGVPAAGRLPTADVTQVLAEPAAFTGKKVELAGTVAEVCQESGCWLRIADPAGGAGTVFVKFTCPVEGEFLIPKDAVGKPVVVEGEVVVEDMPEAEARHMAEDAGKSAEEIARIVGPQKTIRVMSPSARVKA